jgi:catechol 2,3-dioxygenase-like lactoylglutathione lyase family enzyme
MQFKIEHFAINVADPVAMADWYEKNLGLKVVKKVAGNHNTHFLGDYSGSVMIEIYNNPPNQVPDYSVMNPLIMHLAFVSEDPTADKEGLLNVGATFVEEVHLPDGSHLVMMRDPWGLSIQFCKRGRSMSNN